MFKKIILSFFIIFSLTTLAYSATMNIEMIPNSEIPDLKCDQVIIPGPVDISSHRIEYYRRTHPRPPSPTPIPAPIFLLGSGLVSLIIIKRKNKK